MLSQRDAWSSSLWWVFVVLTSSLITNTHTINIPNPPAVPTPAVNHDDADRPQDDDDFVEDSSVEEVKVKHPLIELAEKRWLLQRPDTLIPSTRKQTLIAEIKSSLTENHMLPYYHYLHSLVPSFSVDDALLSEWATHNDKAIADLDAKIEEAKDTGGDTEYRDALLNKANYYAQIGDREKAIAGFEETYGKTIGASSQIDVAMALLRLGYAFDDLRTQKKYITRLKELIEKVRCAADKAVPRVRCLFEQTACLQ